MSGTGPANSKAGKAAMRRAVDWLIMHGAPHADLQNRKSVSDITGVGDVAIEVTTEEWFKISGKMDQARDDGLRRGLGDNYRVWKPRRAAAGRRNRPVGEWFSIMPVGQDWRREQLIGELEREVLTLRKMVRESIGQEEVRT
jgi:hypothetical protein